MSIIVQHFPANVLFFEEDLLVSFSFYMRQYNFYPKPNLMDSNNVPYTHLTFPDSSTDWLYVNSMAMGGLSTRF
jgi:hypothetical protein